MKAAWCVKLPRCPHCGAGLQLRGIKLRLDRTRPPNKMTGRKLDGETQTVSGLQPQRRTPPVVAAGRAVKPANKKEKGARIGEEDSPALLTDGGDLRKEAFS